MDCGCMWVVYFQLHRSWSLAAAAPEEGAAVQLGLTLWSVEICSCRLV